jgi:hypothetical protein
MSTVTSADGTTIDYDAYGAGPAVILIGGASQYGQSTPEPPRSQSSWRRGLHGSRLVPPRVAPSRRSLSARFAWASIADRRAACLSDC